MGLGRGHPVGLGLIQFFLHPVAALAQVSRLFGVGGVKLGIGEREVQLFNLPGQARENLLGSFQLAFQRPGGGLWRGLATGGGRGRAAAY